MAGCLSCKFYSMDVTRRCPYCTKKKRKIAHPEKSGWCEYYFPIRAAKGQIQMN